MRFDHLKSLYISGAVFLLLLTLGFCLSQRKTLWLDELYTQHTAIDADSYAGLLTLKFPDGNKNPLFYIIQKGVCDIFSYRMPAIYAQEFGRVRDIPSETILRIPANVYMSLALSLIVYFFTRFYSIGAALYAFGVALASPMVWMYWVEARPYGLWFLLTTAQLLLLMHALIAPKVTKIKSILWVHLLLAFTTPTSILQITIATLMLWWKGKTSLKQLAFIWVMPMAIAFFYYSFDSISKIKTYMFTSNLFDAVMPERLFIYIIYALVAWVLPEKYRKLSWNILFLPVFVLFFASGVLILFVDLFTQNSSNGFFSRYLIYLAPPDILMFSLASIDFYRWSRPAPWICLNVSIFLGGLVIIRGLMTYRDILGAALFLHSPG